MISSICFHSELEYAFKIVTTEALITYFFSFVNFRTITLKPGDVILTGTPSGVGMHRKPAEFLSPGDLIESEIQSIGKIRNTVVAPTA